jgi:hypothetical protein
MRDGLPGALETIGANAGGLARGVATLDATVQGLTRAHHPLDSMTGRLTRGVDVIAGATRGLPAAVAVMELMPQAPGTWFSVEIGPRTSDWSIAREWPARGN